MQSPMLSEGTLVVFLLVLARTTAWASTAPLLGTKGIPGIARLAVGIALAVFFTPLAAIPHPPTDTWDIASLVLVQALFGLALGWLTNLWLTALEMAGTLVDFQSGFSVGAVLDPLSGAQSAAFARLANMSAVAILFATGGYEAIIRGFGLSFTAVPVDVVPHVAHGAVEVIAHVITDTILAALEIAAPLLGVLFLTEVVVAIASRLAPTASPQAYSMSIKSLVALGLGGVLLAVLPTKTEALLGPALHLGGQVLR